MSFLIEMKFFLRSKVYFLTIGLLALLASLAVGVGLKTVADQQQSIAQALSLQTIETAEVKRFVTSAGDTAYYRFHLTWDEPSPLAFAALGQSDVAPKLLKVRALALEGQIYENETQNPELAILGRFDLAFVLIYLTPLVLITLLHDLWSRENEARRLKVLQSLPGSLIRVWGMRIAVRLVIVSATLLIPFWVGAAISDAKLLDILAFSILIMTLILFWAGLCVIIAIRPWASSTHAAVLASIWFSATLIAPTAANLIINAQTPLPSGAAIMRDNREAVHDAWDIDRSATLDAFYKLYPKWSQSAPMKKTFEWKWYFAFQHLGDVKVAPTSNEYRQSIELREKKARIFSYFLPPIAIQGALHSLARTDTRAQAAYERRIRTFHDELRYFYYPYLFDDKPFTAKDYDLVPEFKTNR